MVEGFAVQRLEPGRWRKHREFRLWFNLSRYVWRRRHDFDILHSHGAYYTHAFIGPLSRVAGLKSLVKASLANDDLLDLNLPLIGYLHRLMLRCINACVAISLDLVRGVSGRRLESGQDSPPAEWRRYRLVPPLPARSAVGHPRAAWGCLSTSRSPCTWACWTSARTSSGWPSSG